MGFSNQHLSQAYSGIYAAQQEQASIQGEYDSLVQANSKAERQLLQTRDTAASLQQEQAGHDKVSRPATAV